ncbi:MAG TPA: energy transducer TonB [Candidatus Eisenbacteria bacterium]|nr:energy transducer TonB [Candidatus Eisenbacteria bacterium]
MDTILCHTVRSTRAAPSKLWISDLTSALVRSTVRSSERPFRADVGVRLLEGDIVTDLLISVEERRILLATMEPPIVEIVPDEPFSSILRILRRALPTNQVIGDAIEEEEAAVLRSQSKSENGSPLWPDCVPGAAAGEFVFYEDEPVPIATPEPVLPPGTKQREVTRVTLHVFVDRSGRVCFAKVIKGMEPFASSAIEAARHWTFKPAMSHGKPVGVWVELPFTFKP